MPDFIGLKSRGRVGPKLRCRDFALDQTQVIEEQCAFFQRIVVDEYRHHARRAVDDPIVRAAPVGGP